MAQPSSKSKQTRRRFSAEYKGEALKLAAKLGVPTAARELGLDRQQLYNWRRAAQLEHSRSSAERELSDENARLKRQLAEAREEVALLKKFSAYVAKDLS